MRSALLGKEQGSDRLIVLGNTVGEVMYEYSGGTKATEDWHAWRTTPKLLGVVTHRYHIKRRRRKDDDK